MKVGLQHVSLIVFAGRLIFFRSLLFAVLFNHVAFDLLEESGGKDEIVQGPRSTR